MNKVIEAKVHEYVKRVGKTMYIVRGGSKGRPMRVKVKTRDFVIWRNAK